MLYFNGPARPASLPHNFKKGMPRLPLRHALYLPLLRFGFTFRSARASLAMRAERSRSIGILSSDKMPRRILSELSRVSKDKVTQGQVVESSVAMHEHSAVLHNPRSTHWNAASP